MQIIASILNVLLWVAFIVVFIRVALSWMSPYPTNDFSRFIFRVTDPVLMPLRRWIPPVSGLDLSPLVLTIAIFFLMAVLRNIG